MVKKYLQLWDDNQENGFISIEDIYWLDVSIRENQLGERNWIVKGFEKDEDRTQGWILSPNFTYMEDAYNYLEKILRSAGVLG